MGAANESALGTPSLSLSVASAVTCPMAHFATMATSIITFLVLITFFSLLIVLRLLDPEACHPVRSEVPTAPFVSFSLWKNRHHYTSLSIHKTTSSRFCPLAKHRHCSTIHQFIIFLNTIHQILFYQFLSYLSYLRH